MLLRLDGRLVFIRLNILSRGSAHTAQAAQHTKMLLVRISFLRIRKKMIDRDEPFISICVTGEIL